ncbi:MAG: D-arabinose 5-phosphate isomerase [Gammaproteobacteria bacterium]|nr:MAG: D-arabinose 5-phosphate isomerase [Gammaproteobacteria bacterium]
MNRAQVKALATAVIETENRAVADLVWRVNDDFVRACEFMMACEGRVVVTGMGKSGHIGSKIAATLASTGTPAFFVHPGEASHGDLGMITNKDVVLAISNSGETNEIITILPIIKRLGVPLIAMTGKDDSSLAATADVHINVGVKQEACPLNLAPTASTTATLVMGDALAVALLENRGFTEDDFALSHPGGALGRRLLLRVGDIMHAGKDVPVVSGEASFGAALMEMTSKGLGMTAVVDAQQKLLGVFTDGDLRRSFDAGIDVKNAGITEVMTQGSISVNADMLAAEVLQIMDKKKINAMVVVDDDHHVIGALNMHDLLRAGVM